METRLGQGTAPLSLRWKRLLRDPVRAPDSSSCPEEASASKPAQEGFWFLWDVLSCLSGPGVLSCHVLLCVCSPGGLLIPPDFPREILLGGKRGSGCRGRAEGTEAKAPEDHLPWPPELPTPPWPPELPAPPWSLSVCSALEVPVLCSCPCLSWGASRTPTPPPRWNCLGSGRAFQEGGVMSVLCRVCHVFPPLVSIFGLFPVLVSCHYELSMFQLCLCDCVNYPVYLVPVFWVWFRLVYLWLSGVSCLSALPCPALSTLKTIIWV